MIERAKLNLEFKYPSDRSSFLLGSIALYKRFQKEWFTDDEVYSYLNSLSNVIPVYKKGPNPTNIYSKRGILEKNPKSFKRSGNWINQYRVIL